MLMVSFLESWAFYKIIPLVVEFLESSNSYEPKY